MVRNEDEICNETRLCKLQGHISFKSSWNSIKDNIRRLTEILNTLEQLQYGYGQNLLFILKQLTEKIINEGVRFVDIEKLQIE